MKNAKLLSMTDVARRSGLSYHRIKAMVLAGALVADRSAKPWLVDEVEYRRVFEPREPTPAHALELSPEVVSRLADAVARQVLAALAAGLTRSLPIPGDPQTRTM